MTAPVVLIAEDSLVVRAVLRGHLEDRGFRVVEAQDGPEALVRCAEVHPDAVLLDVEMPGMNGHEVLERMKAHAELRDTPVVFLTGLSATTDVVKGLDLGAHDYLRKPFEPAELLARVSAAVRIKALQDELKRRNAELDVMSRTDALTGLFNRRHLEGRLSEHAARGGGPVGVVMIDIDHFKRVNDTYGHSAGDAVIRAVADDIRSVLSPGDVPGRWGGEEFLVVLVGDGGATVGALGEAIRRRVGAHVVELPGGPPITVTVSVGTAVGAAGEPEGVIRRADEALYLAKASGRNAVRHG